MPETVASAQHVDPAKGRNHSHSASESSEETTRPGARGHGSAFVPLDD